MEQAFTIAAVWMGLALVSTVLASHMKLSMALVEICVGMVAGLVAENFFGPGSLHADAEWLRFFAATGAVLLTFLAGAELDPETLRVKLKEVTVVGLMGFFAPFLGCAAVARFILGWDSNASWLAGVTLSSTSIAIIYSVMFETGFNRTAYGKGILGSCFVTGLGTLLALGLLFAPFTWKTVVFVVACAAAIAVLPRLTGKLIRLYGNRTAAVRTKWVLFALFALGALAQWSGSVAVLPAYIAGMVLAGGAARDHQWIRRLRTLTVGLLTPFYFLRAGSLVSVSAIVAAPLIFIALFSAKVASKIFGLYPIIARFCDGRDERWYYTLLMSTGLTFGTISALYGFSHGIVSREQYSFLVSGVIASAVIPTMIATIAFTPKHLLPASGGATSARLASEGSPKDE